jgi:parallel beta-helix repeat protein
VTIQNNSLTNNAFGLWISSAYGPMASGNAILNNQISGSAGFGIAVDRDGVGAVIRSNQIHDSGYGGIE